MTALPALFSLAGKVAIVTGGSRGLGKEMAWALAAAGARVAISARREQWLRAADTEFTRAGFECLAATCDVAQAEQVQTFVQRVLDRFGHVDVLFNNAGISWGAPAVDMPVERWRNVLDVNATGSFLMAQAVGRHMIERRGQARGGQARGAAHDEVQVHVRDEVQGRDEVHVRDEVQSEDVLARRMEERAARRQERDASGGHRPAVTGKIVNVSSIMGLRGQPPEVVTAAGYSASKGALIALTRALAVEWAPHDITVNAIAPGFFPTRMSEGVIHEHEDRMLARIPLRRFGNERDIQGVAVFLASAASDYLTGQVLSLDGGATAL